MILRIKSAYAALNGKQKKLLLRIIAAGILLLCHVLTEDTVWVKYIFFALSYAVIGYDILKKAFRGILKGQPFDENFLMAVASLGVVAMVACGWSDDIVEACAVLIFYQIGELFESIAVGKSRRSITELIDIRPDYANIELPDGELERVDPDSVETGSTIVVKPGEKIPIDGIITEGTTSLDVAALTGESRMKDATVGSEVLSGSINMTGVIKLTTTKEFCDSTASKILDLVENASSRKSKSEDFISKFARIYTPVVCIGAVALAVIPSLITGSWQTWIYRALTFLVISCPCALVISIPLTFFAGLGGAGNLGILIKGSNYMEPLSRASYMVFDKTGTMTKGVFEVCGVHHSPIDEDKLIEYAACAECFSSHPIALSILRKYGQSPDPSRVTNVHEYSGEGVTAEVDGHSIVCGNTKLLEREGILFSRCGCKGTLVHVAIDGIYSGHMVIADAIKPNAAASIAAMPKNGVKKTVMLTGDVQSTANDVAAELNIDEVFSDLLPADKVLIVERMLEKKLPGENLIFVGDGINDAPVLARADVGIAMGSMGSDAAIEAADVVLMDDDPLKIIKTIRIARKCMRIVYENIWFAIGIKIACLILSAFGVTGMWLAIFADTGVLIIAVLNAIRALNVRNL